MVDDVFRSYRNHDTVDPEGSEQTARGGIGDPLAELARLTGQPYGDGGRDGGQIGRRTTPVPSSVSRARSIILPSSVPNHPLWRDPNHPLWRDSAGSRRSSRPPDIFPAPQSNSNGVAEDVTIRQRFVRFNTHAQGSRLHPAEMISSRFCRAPEPRRSCPLCRMAGTLARCGRLRLTKLSAPIAFTMLARARAGGSLW